MDKATFLALAKQICEYAFNAVAINIDSFQPLETLLKASELKTGQKDFLFSA